MIAAPSSRHNPALPPPGKPPPRSITSPQVLTSEPLIGDDAFSEAGGVSADDVIDGAACVTKRGQGGSGAEGAVEHADGEGQRRPALVAIAALQRLAAGEAGLLEDAPFGGGGAALGAGGGMAEHVA